MYNKVETSPQFGGVESCRGGSVGVKLAADEKMGVGKHERQRVLLTH